METLTDIKKRILGDATDMYVQAIKKELKALFGDKNVGQLQLPHGYGYGTKKGGANFTEDDKEQYRECLDAEYLQHHFYPVTYQGQKYLVVFANDKATLLTVIKESLYKKHSGVLHCHGLSTTRKVENLITLIKKLK